MNGHSERYIKFLQEQGEQISISEFKSRRNANTAKQRGLKVAYHSPDGEPVYTDNDEVVKHYNVNQAAKWGEKDFEFINKEFDLLQDALDRFRAQFNKLNIGDKMYLSLSKERREFEQEFEFFKRNWIWKTHFCKSGERMPDLDEIDPSDLQRIRAEELETNAYLERREKV